LPVCRAGAVRHPESMENELVALSNELAGAVEQAGHGVVAVNARPRFASSGVLWRPGIVVTAEHAIRRREEIGITLADGRTTSATLAGRDAGTDLAVLKLAENGAPTAPLKRCGPAKWCWLSAARRIPESTPPWGS
jgi:S1-C subfamily serine protease